MKLTFSSISLNAVLFLLGSVWTVVQAKKCNLRPQTETSVVELDLPRGRVLGHAESDLRLETQGLHAIVTRREVPAGTAPKVYVKRYSMDEAPSLSYDEVTGTVKVAVAGCGSSSESGDDRTVSAASVCSAPSSFWMNLLFLSAGALATTKDMPGMGLLFAAGTALTGVQADGSDDCMPVAEIIVEAPSAYRGVIETCLDEVNDPAICPEPFPEFATCDGDVEPECRIAVVGAGTGGLYTALRMVDSGLVEASDICIFEQTERVGGRLFSLRGLGPDNDLVIDAGGYRTWPRFTPTAHALITEYLGLTMDCYDDTDPCEVYNIVDENGKKAGFTLFVEEMMKRLVDGGACFFPRHELVKIEQENVPVVDPSAEPAVSRQFVAPTPGIVTNLYFGNGVVATATGTTILNIPQRPLLSIIRNSDFDAKGLIDAPTLDALHSVQTVIAQKLYLYYPRGSVWWRKLGIVSGDFEYPGDAREMVLAGRYHDGPVYCDDENDPDTCHGFLLAVYNNDLSGNKAQYFRRFQRDREEPVTVFTNQDLEGAEFLAHAHQRLVDFHQLYNTDATYTGFQASTVFSQVEPPPYAFLSTWNTAVPWAGGAWHAWTDLDNIETAKQPFAEHNMFVVNEAYSLLQGWAEGAVKLADEILEEHFGVQRPWDFDVVDVNQLVRQTNSEECVVADAPSGGGGGGGSGSDGSGGGGSSAEDAILCFEGSSLIEMADGSYKKLEDVRMGDFVATGVDGVGPGLVTKALKHAVGREVSVSIIETPQGELVGTPDHPVFVKGEWKELQDLPEGYVSMKSEIRHIDFFYNLEVDGNLLDAQEASHSYVVNGMMASGLGDHEELNRRFPRQSHFIAQSIAEAQ